MVTHLPRFSSAFFSFLLVVLPIPGQLPEKNAQSGQQRPTPSRTDFYGDPLPAGALLRLGTVRLRHGLGVYSVAFSLDGRTLASAGGDGRVKLWDVATGKEVRLIAEGPQREFTFVAFSPDGRTLASGGPEGGGIRNSGQLRPVYLWDVATGKEIRQLPGHEASLGSAVFSPNGKILASATHDGVVRFWDWTQANEIRRVKGIGASIAFSPDSRFLACAGGTIHYGKDQKTILPGGGEIRIWEVETGKEMHHLTGDQSDVKSVAFSPDHKTLAASSEDKVIRIWDVATGKELRQLTQESAGDSPDNGKSDSLAFAPNGSMLASGGRDGTIRLWDPATGKELRRLTGHKWWVVALAFSPDGKVLASGSWDGTIRLWDVATGNEVLPYDEHQKSVHAAFSPDGTLLATGGHDGRIQLWDARTGKKRLRLRLRLPEHSRGVTCFAFSPDGNLLASGGVDSKVRLWNTGNGQEVRQLLGHQKTYSYSSVSAVAFTPDGKLLVSTGSHDQTMVFWEVATGKELRRVQQRGISAAVFSPDGKILAAGGWDDRIHLREAATGKEIRVMPPEPQPGSTVDSVAFSPDGKTLASGSHDSIVRLWDVATGAVRHSLKGHQDVVWSVAFSPDGKLLASGGLDETVRLWEVATQKEVHRLRGHLAWVLSVAFSPDGKQLISGGLDSTAVVWQLSPTVAGTGAGQPDSRNMETLWADLAGDDASRAYRAGWLMAEEPGRSIPLLKEKLQPVILKDAPRIQRLIADLDSDEFAVRDRAYKDLAEFGAGAEPALRQVLDTKPSLEVRRRVERLVAQLSGWSREKLRGWRALAVLECIGTREAREVLKSLAKGEPEALLTKEAKTSLERLVKRDVKRL
jgi:WD40 repeat protein